MIIKIKTSDKQLFRRLKTMLEDSKRYRELSEKIMLDEVKKMMAKLWRQQFELILNREARQLKEYLAKDPNQKELR